MPVQLETARLIVRCLTEDDVPAYRQYLESNRGFHKEWTPRRGEEYYGESSIRRLIVSRAEAAAARSAFLLGVFRKDVHGLIGSIGVTNIVYGAFLSCNLGYELSEGEIGNGYMTEALPAVIEFCFGDLALHRIEASVLPRNERSRRLLRRLGFEYEGTSKRYLKIDGEWQDHEHYVLLNARVE
jgi:[ribosomal protein S5]-alanine N-acetyltransferase